MQQANLKEFLDDFGAVALVMIQFRRDGRDLFPRKIPHEFLAAFLFFGQTKVNHMASFIFSEYMFGCPSVAI
jgi:hypothetical protein